MPSPSIRSSSAPTLPKRVLALAAAVLSSATGASWAQSDAAVPTAASPTSGPSNGATGPVIVAGVVPDEVTRQAILGKAREVYGDRVVDRLGVGRLVAPPRWGQYVQTLITPELKRVSHGQLKIAGNVVEVTGDVANEAQSQQLASRMSAQLNPTYTVRNGLRVAAADQQVLDAALANRIVEFQPGNAVLTPVGLRTLEALLPVLGQFQGRRFEVIGHTDALGAPAQNLALSAERAASVKSWLIAHGLGADAVATRGAGADRPIADNASAEGRARNRRIEFRVLP